MIYQFLQNRHEFDGDFSAKPLFPIIKDVVCGMRLSASEAFDSKNYLGQIYYFCASGCRDKFSKHPGHYVKKEVINAPRP
ncbi:YHS domain-containing protein [Candidatus Saccharibacteria bacterium]|nr:YHS domain-containing protein [Candidatus Saccharibacteria bacterium]